MSNRLITVGLVAVFLALISLMLGVGQMGLRAMYGLRVDARNIAENQWQDVQLATQAFEYSNRNSQLNLQIVVSDDQNEIHALRERRDENSVRISELLARLQTRVGSQRERERMDAVVAASRDYQDSWERVNHLRAAGEKTSAQKLLTRETIPRLAKYHSAFSAYVDFQSAEMNDELAKSAARYSIARTRDRWLIGLSVLLALAIAAFVVPKVALEMRRRQGAERELRKLNMELEDKVNQRTAALEKSNLDLSTAMKERKRNEELVRRLSTAVEQCPVSVVITDLGGCMTYVNRKFLECTGYTYEEAIGRNPRTLKSGRTTPETYTLLWKTITAGGEWRGEFCNRKKNGDLYWEYALIRPILDEKGKIAHFLAIKEDITERRGMETQLQQAQKLEAVGRLAAGIAHEINTPMQFIGDDTRFLQQAWTSLEELLGLLGSMPASSVDEAILRRLVDRLDAIDLKFMQNEVPKAIGQSLEGIDRVTRIVRAMKEFSHPGTDEKCLADINQAIETTITVARNEWKYVADLETSFAKNIGPVPCYVGEFNQVILNLVVNAAHAIAANVGNRSNGKGKITIRTCRKDNFVEISIGDTGCGIPPAIQSHIFEPFFTTKEPGKGTGQGLALAYSAIVKKHGGSIRFETKEGKGTTFFIRIPF